MTNLMGSVGPCLSQDLTGDVPRSSLTLVVRKRLDWTSNQGTQTYILGVRDSYEELLRLLEFQCRRLTALGIIPSPI